MEKAALMVLVFLVDAAALYAAWAIQFSASADHVAALLTAGALGVYSCWTYYLGFREGRK